MKHHIGLPEKNEQVLFCKLTDYQAGLYREYLESDDIKRILSGRMQVFMGLNNLRKLCNHPDIFKDFESGKSHSLEVKSEEGDEEEKEDDSSIDSYGHYERSGKMIVIHSLLKLWRRQGHRVLIFTQSRKMQAILRKLIVGQKYEYLAMDGTTAIGQRQKIISKFNATPEIFAFLLTTKVGGLGVNLTGANRVVIYDPDWNPSVDTQARERAWRIGQEKPVTIYRLMTAGTIEEKIYHRQIFKQFLVDRVLKDPKQRRFFKSSDLHELFTFNDESDNKKTETSAIFAGTGSDVTLSKSKKKNEKKEVVFEGSSSSSNRRISESRRKSNEDPSSSMKCATHNDHHPPRKQEEKLRERIKAISKKIGDQKKKTSREGHGRKKFKKLDGERVPHLVKAKSYKITRDDGGGKSSSSSIINNEKVEEKAKTEEKNKSAAEQDNYVLAKLLKRNSGCVHSAFQHDKVMETSVSDFALVEAEAEKAAREAVEHLRQSRRVCFRPETGIPTWTGNSGGMKRRFGKKKTASESYRSSSSTSSIASLTDIKKFGSSTSGSRKKQIMSAKELLGKIQDRNRFLSSELQTGNNRYPSSSSSTATSLFFPESKVSSSTQKEADYMEVLADIRNFVAFQSSSDGQASTLELLKHFHQRLPPQQSPLFKALLTKICSFHRDTEGKGIWSLKAEFS